LNILKGIANAADFRKLYAAQALHAGLVILIPNVNGEMQQRLFVGCINLDFAPASNPKMAWLFARATLLASGDSWRRSGSLPSDARTRFNPHPAESQSSATNRNRTARSGRTLISRCPGFTGACLNVAPYQATNDL
jgi:hypothetical protein